MKLSKYVISGFMVCEDFHTGTQPARFFREDRANPIHGSFLARRRFGFHKPF